MIELTTTTFSLLPLAYIGLVGMVLISIGIFGAVFTLAIFAIEKLKDINNDDCDY